MRWLVGGAADVSRLVGGCQARAKPRCGPWSGVRQIGSGGAASGGAQARAQACCAWIGGRAALGVGGRAAPGVGGRAGAGVCWCAGWSAVRPVYRGACRNWAGLCLRVSGRWLPLPAGPGACGRGAARPYREAGLRRLISRCGQDGDRPSHRVSCGGARSFDGGPSMAAVPSSGGAMAAVPSGRGAQWRQCLAAAVPGGGSARWGRGDGGGGRWAVDVWAGVSGLA